MRADGACQRARVGACNWRFARAIDVRQHQRLAVGQHFGEVVEAVAGAGESVRLEDGKDAPPGKAFRRGLQYRADFVGVVAVVLKHFGAAVFVFDDAVVGEAAADALELRQSGGNFRARQPQLAGDDEGGKRV